MQRENRTLNKTTIIFSVLLFTACSRSVVSTVPNAQSLLCSPKTLPPIHTHSEAICFAAYVDNLQDSLQQAQLMIGYSGWKVRVQRIETNNEWQVHIQSTGNILPGYHCSLLFTEKGTPINSTTPLSVCGYNK